MPRSSNALLQVMWRGIDSKILAIKRLDSKLDNIDMAPVVRGVGEGMQKYWRGGGVGWRPLSDMTQKARSERGYNPNHPILRQSGGLYEAAVEGPMSVRDGVRSARVVGPASSYSRGGGSTYFSAYMWPGRATMHISGDKVANHFGGITPEGFVIPPRPFWGLNPDMMDRATNELSDSLKDAVDEVGDR